ncbi:MAG: hypothetical protein CM1200mP26_25010 [Acidimicrobiales bacterium]|nr:MAG: hypothetical protein CM1200mP26_25010 [Acidimicrobiales bacterium]
MARWKGAPLVNDRCCLTVCTAPTSSVGACTQPTFHPVRPKDLPPEEMVTVRSAIPGRVANGMWRVPS